MLNEKRLTVRVVDRGAHGGRSGDPVVVDGLVGGDDDAVALAGVDIDKITSDWLVGDTVDFDDRE
jgi:hypothetical protein